MTYIPQPGDPYSESVYPCCEHCADDPVHDVPKDGHTVDCLLCRATLQALVKDCAGVTS